MILQASLNAKLGKTQPATFGRDREFNVEHYTGEVKKQFIEHGYYSPEFDKHLREIRKKLNKGK